MPAIHTRPGDPLAAGPPARSRRVLLVEDNDDAVVLLRMLLERRGFAVTVARTVAAALAAAAATRPEVLLCDIALPDGSGLDVVRQLRAGGPLPAIAMSGLVREVDVHRAREAGFDEYLSKPVSISELVDALERVCGGERVTLQ